jgi:hypothetical protein
MPPFEITKELAGQLGPVTVIDSDTNITVRKKKLAEHKRCAREPAQPRISQTNHFLVNRKKKGTHVTQTNLTY